MDRFALHQVAVRPESESLIFLEQSLAQIVLCANRSERFYIMLVYNGVPELAYECQGQGQVNNGHYTKNEEEEARDASFMSHFQLMLQR